jgi:hypothetical protein
MVVVDNISPITSAAEIAGIRETRASRSNKAVENMKGKVATGADAPARHVRDLGHRDRRDRTNRTSHIVLGRAGLDRRRDRRRTDLARRAAGDQLVPLTLPKPSEETCAMTTSRVAAGAATVASMCMSILLLPRLRSTRPKPHRAPPAFIGCCTGVREAMTAPSCTTLNWRES